MAHLDPQTLQLIVISVVALALLFQVALLTAIFLGMRKAIRTVNEDLDEVCNKVMPIIENTRVLVARVSPKIEATAVDVAALAHTLRVQTNELQSTTTEIMERARRQASRVDHMTTSVLDAADRTGNYVADTVAKPIRQLSGILAGVKAALETLRSAGPTPPRTNRRPGDPDMFV